jgi:hypothetical protein
LFDNLDVIHFLNEYNPFGEYDHVVEMVL